MNWHFLKTNIYYNDGSLRDLYVHQTSRTHWKTWTEFVNKNHRLDWFNGKTNRDENQIDLAFIEEFWDGAHDFCSIAKVYIGNIQINAHFFDDTEMENDIDPKEFNSLDDHHLLIQYMSELSSLLNKEVILTPENERKTILIKVNKDEVHFG